MINKPYIFPWPKANHYTAGAVRSWLDLLKSRDLPLCYSWLAESGCEANLAVIAGVLKQEAPDAMLFVITTPDSGDESAKLTVGVDASAKSIKRVMPFLICKNDDFWITKHLAYADSIRRYGLRVGGVLADMEEYFVIDSTWERSEHNVPATVIAARQAWWEWVYSTAYGVPCSWYGQNWDIPSINKAGLIVGTHSLNRTPRNSSRADAPVNNFWTRIDTARFVTPRPTHGERIVYHWAGRYRDPALAADAIFLDSAAARPLQFWWGHYFVAQQVPSICIYSGAEKISGAPAPDVCDRRALEDTQAFMDGVASALRQITSLQNVKAVSAKPLSSPAIAKPAEPG